MLMALLFSESNELVAAAPACDQVSLGNEFWLEVHEANLSKADILETAYMTIQNKQLRDQLLMLGIDQSIDGFEMARLVESSASPDYLPHRAA